MSMPASASGITPLTLWNTYYKLSDESQYSGAADTPIFDMQGNTIKMVPRAFFADFCIEGSGKLTDGRIVNYAGPCSYQQASFPYCGNSCYAVLDAGQYPWGKGNNEAALVPLRSIATDHNTIPFGTNVYIAEFDGLQIPSVDGLGGFTHDGCFIAQDSGGAINGNHIDIFAGSTGMYRAMEALMPTHSTLTAYPGVTDCGGGIMGGNGPIIIALATAGVVVAGALAWNWYVSRGQK